ncbi:MAG: outer rane efflux protein [Proteobacteria bacterium]|nr:outer rane efflux protein [Pseudomonadota bacterium]
MLTQIRDKVGTRVEVGEAPRYEQVKAEAELLNAVKLRESATVRVEDAKSALRALFGPALPPSFEAQGDLPPPLASLPPLESLREEILARQPVLQQARAEVDRAQAKLRLEEKSRYPVPTLLAGVERDPGLEQWRVGVALPLPLWNQRQGPIGEARADLQQSEALANLQEFTTLRELESAYNRFRIAQRQVETFETGLLRQAESALKVAEAAYRLGERGILDYLDAQRTYRSVRLDFLNARFDRQAAIIDLERLRAADLKDKQP